SGNTLSRRRLIPQIARLFPDNALGFSGENPPPQPAARKSSASGFAVDSLQEGAEFEPSVPLEVLTVSGSSLVVSADLSTLPSRKRSSQRTQRWREKDSNLYGAFPVK